MDKTEMRDQDDFPLDDFFAAARGAAPEPTPALLTQMALQAEVIAAERQAAEAATRDALRRRTAPRTRGGLIAALAGALGGWGTLGGMAGGMATATLAGLWIGLAQAPALMQSAGFVTAAAATTAVTTEAGSETTSYFNDADILALAMVE